MPLVYFQWHVYLSFVFAVSSIFTVSNVKVQLETGDSIQVCGKTGGLSKGTTNSKHWPADAGPTGASQVPAFSMLHCMHPKLVPSIPSQSFSIFSGEIFEIIWWDFVLTFMWKPLLEKYSNRARLGHSQTILGSAYSVCQHVSRPRFPLL